MVGLRFLVPPIGVRIPTPELFQGAAILFIGVVCMVYSYDYRKIAGRRLVVILQRPHGSWAIEDLNLRGESRRRWNSPSAVLWEKPYGSFLEAQKEAKRKGYKVVEVIDHDGP
jgi:hypothetical protein